MKKVLLFFGLIGLACFVQAQDIKLNPPTRSGGKALMETLNERRSERTFVKKEMPVQMLSDLLWAANGFNRPDKRTAPTASNKQELELYVVLDDGAYFYDAKQNVLKLIAKENFKAALGQPNITDKAAVTIVIVADTGKTSSKFAYLDTGYISQNIYLYAASAGLGTVARASYNGAEVFKALQLKEKQEVTLVHPVGFLQ
ncbi:MAG: SagB/ThcOx family dehydrogenase [Odoribacteraceae bacterium]|jgi:SagB-type dehydrogenase family enzyme|nr:SagB/ThcOx family dehydrogenase [Odoribacteraceae bacterium]